MRCYGWSRPPRPDDERSRGSTHLEPRALRPCHDVSFDARFWDLDDSSWATFDGNPPRRIGNPYHDGRMTLLNSDQARFDFVGGQIRYHRHRGPMMIRDLCS